MGWPGVCPATIRSDHPMAAPVPSVHTYVVGTDLCSETDTIVVYHDTSIYIVAPQDPLLVCRPAYMQLQSIANGPRSLGPGESAEAEFAIVGLPDGTRNDLSADNAFTILINSSRREAMVAAVAGKPEPTEILQP